MGLVSKTYTFSSGAIILASEHNTNFDTLYTLVNGNIDNANISASAAIADSKLAQITTAAKVSGAALTALTSTPAAAGKLPIANLPTGLSANLVITCGTDGVLPALDGSLLTNIAAGTISSASLGTGSASASNFLRGDRTWAAVSTGAPVTAAYTANTAGSIYTSTTAGIVVSKTITSGNTVFLNASGYLSANATAASITTVILYAGATSVHTIKVSSSTTDENVPWANNAVVTGLSGATSFWVSFKASANYNHTTWGNLAVLEF